MGNPRLYRVKFAPTIPILLTLLPIFRNFLCNMWEVGEEVEKEGGKEEEEEEKEEKGEKQKSEEEKREEGEVNRETQKEEERDSLGGEEKVEEGSNKRRSRGSEFKRDHKSEEDDQERVMNALEVIKTVADKHGNQLEKAEDFFKMKDNKFEELDRRLELQATELVLTVNDFKCKITTKEEKLENELKTRDNKVGELEKNLKDMSLSVKNLKGIKKAQREELKKEDTQLEIHEQPGFVNDTTQIQGAASMTREPQHQEKSQKRGIVSNPETAILLQMHYAFNEILLPTLRKYVFKMMKYNNMQWEHVQKEDFRAFLDILKRKGTEYEARSSDILIKTGNNLAHTTTFTEEDRQCTLKEMENLLTIIKANTILARNNLKVLNKDNVKYVQRLLLSFCQTKKEMVNMKPQLLCSYT